YNPLFTDDASVVESAGMKVEVLPGSRYNIKITTTEDMPLGEFLLNYF
ncbi:MAG: 2-C-methyl-D-erythritol 4-phosphate cytidylyltransferase, partial [Bacteroidales bacterium]|nr:2-C-methyl-D-erythritol 4-phosphate cytidylyltransferase [Candidatus Egerieousia equi]